MKCLKILSLQFALFFHLIKQLYGHLLPISEIIQEKKARHAGKVRKNKDELISDVLWTLMYRHTVLADTSKTYIYLLCADTGYRQEDLLSSRAKRDGW